MGISFTPDQQKVIELHERNILVSAAAGSGKTAVLVERIIRMVCDEAHPVDIDRLLIVTFTVRLWRRCGNVSVRGLPDNRSSIPNLNISKSRQHFFIML